MSLKMFFAAQALAGAGLIGTGVYLDNITPTPDPVCEAAKEAVNNDPLAGAFSVGGFALAMGINGCAAFCSLKRAL